MIKSMTGFGRAEVVNGTRKITIEMKSVNHRYSEITIKMPKKLNIFEAGIRSVLKEYIHRGKVDVYITYEDEADCSEAVKYNKDVAEMYVKYIRQIADEFGLDNDMHASTIARMPDVLTTEELEVDEEDLWNDVEKAVRSCSEKFVEARIVEGEKLKKDILEKLDGMDKMVEEIIKRSPEIMKEYRERLNAKVSELIGNGNLSEPAVATELIIYADKICTDEETVRLKAHISGMRDSLNTDKDKDVGRKLDFIAQEMNREANTTLSKANDITVSDIAIDLKTEIEKIREQIQNIE